MRATLECLECLRTQAKRTLSYYAATQASVALPILDSLPLCPPPKLAVPVYESISAFVGKSDLYKKSKRPEAYKKRAKFYNRFKLALLCHILWTLA